MICIGKNKEYAQLLLRFSKENDILQDVAKILNQTKVGVRRHEFNPNNFDTIFRLQRFFDITLTWGETEEKFNFWYKIHLKWILFLKQYCTKRDSIHFEDSCRKDEMVYTYIMYKQEFEKLCNQQQ